MPAGAPARRASPNASPRARSTSRSTSGVSRPSSGSAAPEGFRCGRSRGSVRNGNVIVRAVVAREDWVVRPATRIDGPSSRKVVVATMKRWTHSQDILALIVGVYAFLSPIWTTTTGKATGTMIVLGIITALLALAELIRPDMMSVEGVLALMGVLFFISPWV